MDCEYVKLLPSWILNPAEVKRPQMTAKEPWASNPITVIVKSLFDLWKIILQAVSVER